MSEGGSVKRSRCFPAALLAVTALSTFNAAAQEPPLIRFGRGFAAEEQVWLMSARPELTPNQGKKYQLKQILFQANPERFQAFLAGLLNASVVPDKDAKIFPMGFPGMGDAVRTGKINAGTFVEPFYSAEMARGGLRKLFTAVEAVGYDHELLDIWFGEKFLKAHPDAVRAFLADYVAVTKYYLANTAQAKRDLHKAGFVRTPLEIYLKNADWKRDPAARVDVASLDKLSKFMLEKLQWLEKPVDIRQMVDESYLPRQ